MFKLPMLPAVPFHFSFARHPCTPAQRCSELLLSIDCKHDSIVIDIYCLFPMMAVCFFSTVKLKAKWSFNVASIRSLPENLWFLACEPSVSIPSADSARPSPRLPYTQVRCEGRDKKWSRIKLCIHGGCFFFVCMLETRTWIDASCLWTWLCFQTGCTPKSKSKSNCKGCDWWKLFKWFRVISSMGT